jgi:hypothetical protein
MPTLRTTHATLRRLRRDLLLALAARALAA